MAPTTLFIQKYQPLFLKDFEMEQEMRNVLDILIKMNNLNILFIGDIGSGKTSFLNAVIREYYQLEPKDYQDNILHINNLKEQGINYYRNDVKTFCQTCSSIKRKKKFVVLDDIDLINEQSQQVFRNCIDKFSHNVHFVASCTNSQKVIESLQSRLLIIKIKPLERLNLITIVDKIKTIEQIDISDPAIVEFILNISNNTVKTILNYMEKFKLLNQPITLDLALQVCTNVSFLLFDDFVTCLRENKLHEAILLLYSIYDKGYSVMDILDNFFLFVKTNDDMTEKEKYDIIPLLCKYITIFHNIHEDEIELALFTNNLLPILRKL